MKGEPLKELCKSVYDRAYIQFVESESKKFWKSLDIWKPLKRN